MSNLQATVGIDGATADAMRKTGDPLPESGTCQRFPIFASNGHAAAHGQEDVRRFSAETFAWFRNTSRRMVVR